jgi:uncharacterized protein (UPF0276 family)
VAAVVGAARSLPLSSNLGAQAGASNSSNAARQPGVGIGYRAAIAEWTRAKLSDFDLLEITVDHCIYGTRSQQAEIFDLVGRIPLTAHGVGLSIGTDAPLDLRYLDQIAALVERLQAPAYSEHLAFTRVPGRELGNLLPLPRTDAAVEMVVRKVKAVQSRIPIPFLLENISYVFEWPDSRLSDAAFLNLICGETGAGILLDIENLHLNAENHGFDPYNFLDDLSAGLVREMHVAGGMPIPMPSRARPFLADSHSHPVASKTLDLLDYALQRHAPATIIVERDDRLDATDEILQDVLRIRARLAAGARSWQRAS